MLKATTLWFDGQRVSGLGWRLLTERAVQDYIRDKLCEAGWQPVYGDPSGTVASHGIHTVRVLASECDRARISVTVTTHDCARWHAQGVHSEVPALQWALSASPQRLRDELMNLLQHIAVLLKDGSGSSTYRPVCCDGARANWRATAQYFLLLLLARALERAGWTSAPVETGCVGVKADHAVEAALSVAGPHLIIRLIHHPPGSSGAPRAIATWVAHGGQVGEELWHNACTVLEHVEALLPRPDLHDDDIPF